MQRDHLISTRWPDLVITKKKSRTYWIVDFAVLADHGVKLKIKYKKDKYLDIPQELKKTKTVEYESDDDII